MAKPAAQPHFRIKLNLLHPKEVPPPLPERFLKWLISYGRFIVIFVEIIVVAAFLARFKLDADLDDLKKEINKDLPYVEGLSIDEAIIKHTQSRITTFDKTYNQAPVLSDIVKNIASEIPTSVTLTALNMETQPNTKSLTFKINGETLSNVDLGIFLNNLRANKNFQGIVLAGINFDQDQIIFTITGTTK